MMAQERFTQFHERYGDSITLSIRSVVASFDAPDELRRMILFHFGWIDQFGNPLDLRVAKRIRPLLLLLFAEGTGADWHDALPAAAAVEILHNFTLVHDDIQDNSLTRHGQPTIWDLVGIPKAINIGDALFGLVYVALEALQEKPIERQILLDIHNTINRTILALTCGQHLDMSFEQQQVVSTQEYLHMIEGKTASLISACSYIGGLIGSHDSVIANHCRDFGLHLGIAFQIHDDILGIWGDEETTGKSKATDILTKKKSLPVLYGLQQSTILQDHYQKVSFDNADVEQIVAELDRLDVREQIYAQEKYHYDLALQSLEQANMTDSIKPIINELINLLFNRPF
ncbi:MAG: polyprenyl synthetase family protein [Phototrophicaceae bacterium]